LVRICDGQEEEEKEEAALQRDGCAMD